MSPERTTTVNGQLIEEYNWAGKILVYVEYYAWEGTYESAIACAKLAEIEG